MIVEAVTNGRSQSEVSKLLSNRLQRTMLQIHEKVQKSRMIKLIPNWNTKINNKHNRQDDRK